jgi:hypothetical protein
MGVRLYGHPSAWLGEICVTLAQNRQYRAALRLFEHASIEFDRHCLMISKTVLARTNPNIESRAFLWAIYFGGKSRIEGPSVSSQMAFITLGELDELLNVYASIEPQAKFESIAPGPEGRPLREYLQARIKVIDMHPASFIDRVKAYLPAYYPMPRHLPVQLQRFVAIVASDLRLHYGLPNRRI